MLNKASHGIHELQEVKGKIAVHEGGGGILLNQNLDRGKIPCSLKRNKITNKLYFGGEQCIWDTLSFYFLDLSKICKV